MYHNKKMCATELRPFYIFTYRGPSQNNEDRYYLSANDRGPVNMINQQNNPDRLPSHFWFERESFGNNVFNIYTKFGDTRYYINTQAGTLEVNTAPGHTAGDNWATYTDGTGTTVVGVSDITDISMFYTKAFFSGYWLYNNTSNVSVKEILGSSNPRLTTKPYEFQYYIEEINSSTNFTVASSVNNIPEDLLFEIDKTNTSIAVRAINLDTTLFIVFGHKLSTPETKFDESYQVNKIKNDLFAPDNGKILSIKFIEKGIIIKYSGQYFLITANPNPNFKRISKLICKFMQFTNCNNSLYSEAEKD